MKVSDGLKKEIQAFKAALRKEDLAEATVHGYSFDVLSFYNWVCDIRKTEIEISDIDSIDIQSYRKYLVDKSRKKPASVNRRIQSLKRFFKWAAKKRLIDINPSEDIRFMRRTAPTRPQALSTNEVHTLLRVSGKSSHGLSTRNYALLQVMLQAGLRIGEVANLQVRDLILYDRAGSIRIVEGKGHKERLIPMNATLRRALKRLLNMRDDPLEDDPLFLSKRGDKLTIRAVQKVVNGIVRRSKINSKSVSAHNLRHTFATNYLQANPDKLVELSSLLGHVSLDTTTIYTKPSEAALSESIEKMEINSYE